MKWLIQMVFGLLITASAVVIAPTDAEFYALSEQARWALMFLASYGGTSAILGAVHWYSERLHRRG